VAKRDTSEQVRRFGPLTFLLVAAAIAFLVLPSTLTLPNPSPSAQEEIAPVPPTRAKINPPVSNFTSLNSGTTGNGLGTGGGVLPTLPPVKLPPGASHTPADEFACVGGRQTEDFLSPTCVPFFIGENGGATYQGVTATEVRVIMYFSPFGTLNTSQGTSTPPYNKIIDVDKPPSSNEHPAIHSMRAWQKFFNKRYASYHRKVHVFVQFGSYDSRNVQTAGSQAQDAALAYNKYHPFAVVNYSSFGNGNFYNTYMAEHGVLNFGSVAGRSASVYKHANGKQWGFKPPIEYSAAQYANFVCNSIVNKPVSDAAGTVAAQVGKPRKFGFLYTTDPAFEGMTDQALLSMELIKKQCGISYITKTYDHNSYSVDNERTPDYAVQIALDFQTAGVTTILWPAGYEDKISAAMNPLNYYPEFVLGDDDQHASNNGESFQNQKVWAHAWIVTSQVYDPPPNKRICAIEYRTVDPGAPSSDVQNFACDYYNDLRQLWTGIQVAGPVLTPQTLDQGFHAIPIVESTDPRLPTCFYLPNDYTCVKDSTIEHWDGAAQSEGSRNPGCWRMVRDGKRYLPGKFPKTNLMQMKNPKDTCNNFSQAANLSLAP
jgi:hypothetical protein